MPNPKASASTQSYRQTIKSTNTAGNPVTTTFFQSNRTPATSPSQSRGGSGGSSSSATAMGGSVELFIVGSFFIWMIVSGKIQAIIAAAKS